MLLGLERPCRSLCQTLLPSVLSQLPALGASGVCHALWALARFDMLELKVNGAALVHLLTACHLKRKEASMRVSGVAMCQCGGTASRAVAAPAGRVVSCMAAPSCVLSWFVAACERVFTMHSAPQDLASVLWALGRASQQHVDLPNKLAFEEQGQARLFTHAAQLQTRASAALEAAAAQVKLARSGSSSPSSRGSPDQGSSEGEQGSSIRLLQHTCPPGTWVWPPPPSPACAPLPPGQPAVPAGASRQLAVEMRLQAGDAGEVQGGWAAAAQHDHSTGTSTAAAAATATATAPSTTTSFLVLMEDLTMELAARLRGLPTTSHGAAAHVRAPALPAQQSPVQPRFGMQQVACSCARSLANSVQPAASNTVTVKHTLGLELPPVLQPLSHEGALSGVLCTLYVSSAPAASLPLEPVPCAPRLCRALS